MALPTLSGLRVSLPQGFLFVLIKRLSRAPCRAASTKAICGGCQYIKAERSSLFSPPKVLGSQN